MRSEQIEDRRPGRPVFDPAAASQVLRDNWGLEGTLAVLPSDSDQNFRVVCSDGPDVVLRIANSNQTEGFLSAVGDILQALAGAGLGTQRVVPSTTGATLVHIQATAGGDDVHLAWVTEWVEGKTLAEHPDRPRSTVASLGDYLGRLDARLESIDHPALHRTMPWDLAMGAEVIREGYAALRSSESGTPPRMRLFDDAFADHVARIDPLLQVLPKATVHNDPNDHNVLVGGAPNAPVVCGLLDFGDAVHSFRISDLAIGCAYAMLGSETPIADVLAAAEAYGAHRPLTDLEAYVLLPLIRLRLLVSVVMSAKASAVEPDNPYLVVSQQGAWTALEQLATVDFGAVARALEGRERALRAPRTRERDRQLRREREALMGPSLSLSYDDPLTVVRGWKQFLFDESGRAYLDCVNNVCHVGHSHPAVVDAIAEQAELLNTNSRYLHPLRVEYAERLTGLVPEGLDTCFFVSSGSEATELAARLARAATGRDQFVVLDAAYHGSTSTAIDLSPYKFDGPGGSGRPDHVHVAPLPDPFRGPSSEASAYVAGVHAALERAAAQGGCAAFFMESIPSCGGQIVPPEGFGSGAAEEARAAGALVVADEVQTGFGRVGREFWAFELDGVTPDIVTLGKPMGNGHPLGAVVTRRWIADAFANGMEFFSTFGGNPVSCAAGLAVLDVIEREGLQEHARQIGRRLMDSLRDLGECDPRLGDVRGHGLFLGIEFVRPGGDREPDAALAHSVVQQARRAGVLLSTDGPAHNVIKIKPPLVFSAEDVETLTRVLAGALAG